MTNIEIDPITGAPIIKNIVDPTPANPIMPVVAQPTASPGLTAKELVSKVKAILATPSTPSPAPFVVPTPRVVVTADVAEGTSNHISKLYPQIRQILKDGGGDTQQQAQTFEKLKELLNDLVLSE